MKSQSRNYDQFYDTKAQITIFSQISGMNSEIFKWIYTLLQRRTWQRQGEFNRLGLLASNALSVSGCQHLPRTIARNGNCSVDIFFWFAISFNVFSWFVVARPYRRQTTRWRRRRAAGSGGGVAGGWGGGHGLVRFVGAFPAQESCLGLAGKVILELFTVSLVQNLEGCDIINDIIYYFVISYMISNSVGIFRL
jgi:hypothetical protein